MLGGQRFDLSEKFVLVQQVPCRYYISIEATSYKDVVYEVFINLTKMMDYESLV